MLKDYNLYSGNLKDLPSTTLLITTLNAHSYNVARKDKAFAEALQGSDVLIPDGVSVVWGERILRRTKNKDDRTKTLKKIAGEDLFYYEMKRLKKQCTSSIPWHVPKAFFLGSTEEVLAKIKARAAKEFPCIEVHTYSPPYKAEFSAEDNAAMVAAINAVNPDVLFVGMTAPKQEKWAHMIVNSSKLVVNSEELGVVSSSKLGVVSSSDLVVSSEDRVVSSSKLVVGSEEKIVHSGQLRVDSEDKLTDNYKLQTENYKLSIQDCHICCIGAVFDFYAGTVKRAPKWVINIGMEWFYRLVSEPKRMWRRYLVGNVKFVWAIMGEFLKN